VSQHCHGATLAFGGNNPYVMLASYGPGAARVVPSGP